MSAITSELAHLSGPLAYLLVAALVFGETALFIGFVLPGEIAVVLGGVLASRGRVSLPLLMTIVVAAAIIGPLVGYEVGRRMGGRVVASRFLRRVSGTVDKAAAALNSRGAVAVLVGRFTAVLRAMMPALAGTARMPYRTFVVYNAIGGLIWGSATACSVTWPGPPTRRSRGRSERGSRSRSRRWWWRRLWSGRCAVTAVPPRGPRITIAGPAA